MQNETFKELSRLRGTLANDKKRPLELLKLPEMLRSQRREEIKDLQSRIKETIRTLRLKQRLSSPELARVYPACSQSSFTQWSWGLHSQYQEQIEVLWRAATSGSDHLPAPPAESDKPEVALAWIFRVWRPQTREFTYLRPH